jgi:hypothetical protein
MLIRIAIVWVGISVPASIVVGHLLRRAARDPGANSRSTPQPAPAPDHQPATPAA